MILLTGLRPNPSHNMRCLGSSRQFGGKKGFTLIEIILSIVILTVGIISVQRVFIGSLSALSVIENWDQAEALLEEKIWDIERGVKEGDGVLPSSQSNGVLLGKIRTYQYDLNIRAIDRESNFVEATLSVSWKISGIKRSITRHFYLMVPYAAWKTSTAWF